MSATGLSVLGPTTRFGAQWFPLDRAVTVLRARAARTLPPTRVVAPLDAAAAVVGVDAWMLALGALSLDLPTRHGREAVAALAACLARSVGDPAPCGPAVLSPPAPEDWLVVVEAY